MSVRRARPHAGRPNHGQTILFGRGARDGHNIITGRHPKRHGGGRGHKASEKGWAPPERHDPIVVPDELYTAESGTRVWVERFGGWYVRDWDGRAWVREATAVT